MCAVSSGPTQHHIKRGGPAPSGGGGGSSGTGGGGGCLIGGALVHLVDRTVRRIDELSPGDELKGIQGINVVKRVIAVSAGNRKMVSLNGQRAIFTEDHPVKIAGGWAALNTELFREKYAPVLARIGEIHQLEIGQTVIGDPGDFIIESIETIDPANPQTPVYDISVTGDHTYYADGIAFHNKDVAQHGLDRIIPPGFPNDSYVIRATSGERHIILNREQQRRLDVNVRARGFPDNLNQLVREAINEALDRHGRQADSIRRRGI